jgi:hypothetical protein
MANDNKFWAKMASSSAGAFVNLIYSLGATWNPV